MPLIDGSELVTELGQELLVILSHPRLLVLRHHRVIFVTRVDGVPVSEAGRLVIVKELLSLLFFHLITELGRSRASGLSSRLSKGLLEPDRLLDRHTVGEGEFQRVHDLCLEAGRPEFMLVRAGRSSFEGLPFVLVQEQHGDHSHIGRMFEQVMIVVPASLSGGVPVRSHRIREQDFLAVFVVLGLLTSTSIIADDDLN